MAAIRFGKYAGTEIEDLPRDYVEWLIQKCRADLAVYEGELSRRDAVESSSMSTIEKIISTGYRALAKSAHPDGGGSSAAFQDLTAAHETLRMLLKEVASVKGA